MLLYSSHLPQLAGDDGAEQRVFRVGLLDREIGRLSRAEVAEGFLHALDHAAFKIVAGHFVGKILP